MQHKHRVGDSFRCGEMVSGHFCLGCGESNLSNPGSTQCLVCLAEDSDLGNISNVSHQAISGAVQSYNHHVCLSSHRGFDHGFCWYSAVISSMQIPLMQSFMCESTTSMLVPGHQHFLSKACRLNIIQLFVETRQANNIMDVPFVLAKFDDLLIHYYNDYQIEALSDASLKAALRALIPAVLRDIVKDVIMFRSIIEDDLSVVDLRGIIMELIAGPFMRH